MTARLRSPVTGPGGFAIERQYPLEVKPATQILARRTVKPLDPGQSITLTSDVFGDLVPGTGKVALSVTPTAALDVASLLAALDRYPLGCTEQIVSRALPLLYVNELSLDAQLAVDTGIDERIAKAIEIVLARQGSEGAFGLWSPGGDDAWLDAYVTDFLTRARARGFSVSGRSVQARARPLAQLCEHRARRRDRRRAGARRMRSMCWRGTAWRRSATFATSPTPSSTISATPTAKARDRRGARHARRPRQGREGVRRRARRRCQASRRFEGGRIDYGSPLRDAAAVVTLAAEGDAPKLDPGQRHQEHRHRAQ